MKTLNSRILFALFFLLIGLTGCSGSGEDPSSVTDPSQSPVLSPLTTVIEGQVADGYLQNARVFLDRNGNRRPDSDEPSTLSGPKGQYTLTVSMNDLSYPVVAQIVAGETVDEDNGDNPVAINSTLEAPAGYHGFISPLTTLVKHEMDKNPLMGAPEAEVRIREALGIPEEISLFSNYLDTAVINVTPAVSSAALKAHEKARVVNRLLGQMMARLDNEFGGSVPNDKIDAALIVATSTILDNAQNFTDVIQSGTSSLNEAEIDALANQVLSSLPAASLNTETVALYDARLDEKNPVWDVTPPGILSRIPEAEQNAPVGTLISLSFNEGVEETSVSPQTIELQSASGKVGGITTYNTLTHQVTFVPDQPLFAFTRYTATLNPGLTDKLGNQITEPLSWNFTTLFVNSPPEPPVF